MIIISDDAFNSLGASQLHADSTCWRGNVSNRLPASSIQEMMTSVEHWGGGSRGWRPNFSFCDGDLKNSRGLWNPRPPTEYVSPLSTLVSFFPSFIFLNSQKAATFLYFNTLKRCHDSEEFGFTAALPKFTDLRVLELLRMLHSSVQLKWNRILYIRNGGNKIVARSYLNYLSHRKAQTRFFNKH